MIIAWWSGGVTSALACKIAIEEHDDVRVVMLDTMNEHEDTYRFKEDCEKWYGREIEVYKNSRWNSIHEVWYHFKSLSNATGAICSKELKSIARQKFCKENKVDAHVFGFEFLPKEIKRAENWKKNESSNAIFPLIDRKIDKNEAISIIEKAGICIPEVYSMGYNNNNCFGTGCTQGGVGYWQKIRREDPYKYNRMAQLEHDLSELKGSPVVICHNQAKNRVVTKWDISPRTGKIYSKSKCFLRFNPVFPEVPTIDSIRGKHEPIVECNGFCSLHDSENQLDFTELFDQQ